MNVMMSRSHAMASCFPIVSVALAIVYRTLSDKKPIVGLEHCTLYIVCTVTVKQMSTEH